MKLWDDSYLVLSLWSQNTNWYWEQVQSALGPSLEKSAPGSFWKGLDWSVVSNYTNKTMIAPCITLIAPCITVIAPCIIVIAPCMDGCDCTMHSCDCTMHDCDCAMHYGQGIPLHAQFGPVCHSLGLEEVPVVNQPAPGHHTDVGWPHHLLFHVLKTLHVQFGLFIWFPWPRRGTCGPPTWPWPPCRCWPTSSLAFSCPLVPSCPIWGLYVIPMA